MAKNKETKKECCDGCCSGYGHGVLLGIASIIIALGLKFGATLADMLILLGAILIVKSLVKMWMKK